MTWNGLHTDDASPIVSAIRADIVAGRLRTGQEVVLADYAEAFDASMSGVQQALLRLVEQRLVVAGDGGGFRVVAVSRRDLRELTEMRKLLEGEAVRRSAEIGGTEWAERLRSAHDELVETEAEAAEPGLTYVWRAAHAAFHGALYAAADNERLLRTVGALREEAEIYRELAVVAAKDRREIVAREHREMMEHAIAGRAAEAEEVLRRHLEGTRQSVSGGALQEEDTRGGATQVGTD